jgi:hypothetical protein
MCRITGIVAAKKVEIPKFAVHTVSLIPQKCLIVKDDYPKQIK